MGPNTTALQPLDPEALHPDFPTQAFCQSLPFLQKVWDSTSMGTLQKCPRAYELRILRGIVPPSSQVHLQWGIAFHSAMEHVDRARAQGAEQLEAEASALAWLFDHIPREVQETDLRNRDAISLMRAVVWYFDQYRGSDFGQTLILKNGKPAVELSFRYELGIESPDGDSFLSSGHLDRIILRADGSHVVVDYKATKSSLSDSYFAQYDTSGQVSGYLMASRVVFGQEGHVLLIDAVQTGVNFTRFGRHLSRRTDRQLEEWLRDTELWISQARSYAEARYWPKNTSACWSCEYKSICRRDPAVAAVALAEYAEEPHFWNPTHDRGEG